MGFHFRMLSFQVHKNLLRDKQPAITGSQIKAGLGTAVKIGATADTEIIPFSQPAYFPFLAGSIGTVNGLDPDKTDFLQGSNELIKAAVEEGIRVVGVPGCCAAVNALAISGFDLSSFLFYGFFPRENADRRKLLEKMRGADTRTFAFYESPKRIMELVDFLIESEAKLRLCLCNDMTKLHEMSFRGTPAQVKEQLLAKGNYDKGEYAIVAEVEPEYQFTKVEHTVSAEAMLVDAMISGGVSGRDAIAAVLADPNNSYSKNELKAAALNLKRMFE